MTATIIPFPDPTSRRPDQDLDPDPVGARMTSSPPVAAKLDDSKGVAA